MSGRDEPSPRDLAWATRREKYGPRGHAGSYYRSVGLVTAADRARDEISVARRHLQMLLPDKAALKAITALDRADDYLAPFEPARARIVRSSQSAEVERVAFTTALDIADRLIERAYGTDVPQEWNDAYAGVAAARVSVPQGEK